ncbi:MAG TPA: hypothetical protein VF045_01950, partial [Acidimicrobiales bacterium]
MRLRALSSLCLGALLLTTGALHLVSKQAVASSDRQALEDRARDLGAIAVQVGSRIELSMAAIHAVVAATGADQDAFSRSVGPHLQSGLFASAALLEMSGPMPLVASHVGAPPLIGPAARDEHARRLHESAMKAELVPVGRFSGPNGTAFGFSYGPASGSPTRLVYAELPLANIPQLILSDLGDTEQRSSMEALSLAIYADESQRPESLILALAQSLPLPPSRHVQ